jgi:hypothetical protein
MPKNASLTMMRSSAPGLRDAEAKRQSAAFWSGTATNICRSKQRWPVYRPIRRCSRIYAGQRFCGVNGTSTDFTGKQISNRRPPVKPSIVRTWPADILTIDGQNQKTFHILIPRWRLTGGTDGAQTRSYAILPVEPRSATGLVTVPGGQSRAESHKSRGDRRGGQAHARLGDAQRRKFITLRRMLLPKGGRSRRTSLGMVYT